MNIITIDGPAASGKTTLGIMVARQLGYLFFDTGIMYRAVTWAGLIKGIPVNDEDAITKLAENIEVDIQPPSIDDGRNSDILLEGQDITWKIRLPEVDANVSQVSAYPGVRNALSALQRRIGLRGDVVMVGRDIGTVVLPEAGIKVYLDASAEERAKRRYHELIERGSTANLEDILDAMRKRDAFDSTRTVAPLQAAEDATIINTDLMSLEEVFSQIVTLINNKTNPHR